MSSTPAPATHLRDVPVSSAQEIFPANLSLTEEQDKLAVAIQQGY
jgi:hypothetical protein